MSLVKIQVEPEFGTNYEPGLVGFSFHKDSFISSGITIVTGDEAVSGKPISHAFIVEDEKYCLEACGEGVVRSHLDKYFAPEYEVYFKRPQGMDGERANLILDAARAKLGQPYSVLGIVGMLTDKIFKVAEVIPSLKKWRNPFNSKSTWICSELAAFALYCLPEYREGTILEEYHPSRISPQRLFEQGPWDKWSLATPDQVRDRFGKLVIGPQEPKTSWAHDKHE